MDRIVAAKELSFRIGFTGHSGHLRIEPLPPVERDTPLNSIPDFILDTCYRDVSRSWTLGPELRGSI
ncbi:hypothetical protein HAX54_050241 [Datura stramonium]|uniref:Uncharacterized protein n=1 Tax=Datura stramonium TaxID=4076 RepID=A0ABS8SW55_DATST|nr:hypothetical protein [Datura stramonium]